MSSFGKVEIGDAAGEPGSILFLTHEASRTGAPLLLLRFLRWFGANRAVPFRILAARSGEIIGDFETTAETNLFEPDRALIYRALRRLHRHSRYLADYRTHLRDMLSNSNIRLIYANSIASAKMLEFLSFIRCPVICHVHELEGVIQSLGADYVDILEGCSAEYIAVSEAVKRNLVERHHIRANRIRVIHGFVPYPETTPNGAHLSVRQSLGIPASSRIVCGCGSIEYRKGTDIFLQVADQIAQRYQGQSVHFIWVGGGPAIMHEMRRQISKSALRDIVHFVGQTSTVTPYFHEADVFLLPSREDPFPLVIMEAGLNQLPIVCFENAGGASEFVEGGAGFAVPDFSAREMADRVMEILLSPDLQRQMGLAAREKVLRNHNLSVNAAKIADFIDEAMQSHSFQDEHGEMVLSR